MSTHSPALQEDALRWAVRTSDPDFDEWPAFVRWLDGDPARSDAYDDVMVAFAGAADAISLLPVEETTVKPVPASVPMPASIPTGGVAATRSRRWVAGGGLALAASIAAVMVFGRQSDEPAWRTIQTAPGQARTIALADGSRIDLAGGSRLGINPARPRSAELERGRAIFTVRHDAALPFRVKAGDHDVVDAGTTFEIMRDQGLVTVAVAEGLVLVDPARSEVRLQPGDTAEFRAGRRPVLARVAPGSIGQWRRERMSYQDATLARVAADLSAALGRRIIVGPALAERRFTGVLVPATFRDRPNELAAALDVAVRNDAEEWLLVAP